MTVKDAHYRRLQKLASRKIRQLYKITVVGLENVPEDGRQLFCSNHQGALDPFLIGASLSREVHFMAKKELFCFKPMAAFLSSLGAFPVDRKSNDVDAIKKAINLLKENQIVGLFPQGTRHINVDPRQTSVRSGAGMIAFHSKCDVIPAYLYTKNRKNTLFHKTVLIIGKPILFSEFQFTKGGMSEYQRASQMIFERICDIGDAYIKENT
jgi:1-acyl-sn-glycerol-3-phosphate acyltransferase